MPGEIRVDTIKTSGGLGNVAVNSSGINVTGIVTATSFVGNGSGLTNISTLTLGTSQSVSGLGTAVPFTGIPSTAKKITVAFNQISSSGTSNFLLQLGTSAGFTLSGYNSTSILSGGSVATATNGLLLTNIVVAANSHSGLYTIINESGNNWIGMGSLIQCSGGTGASNQGGPSTGQVSLSGTLDRLRITTVTGTDTFDGTGSINIMYEG